MESTWVWMSGQLRDPENEVRARIIRDSTDGQGRGGLVLDIVDRGQMQVELTRTGLHFGINAATSNAVRFHMTQAGFSLNALEAECNDRAYRLERSRRLRRERIITDAAGSFVFRTVPKRAALYLKDQPVQPTIPLADFVFLSLCCLEADNSGRLMRI